MKKSTKLIIALIIVGVMLSLVTFWVVWRDKFNGKINKIDVDVVEEEKTPTIIYNTYHNEVYHNEVYYGSEKNETPTPVNSCETNKPCEQRDNSCGYTPVCPYDNCANCCRYNKYSFAELVNEYDNNRLAFKNHHSREYVEFTCYLIGITDKSCVLSADFGRCNGCYRIRANYNGNNVMRGFVYMTKMNSNNFSYTPVTVRGYVTGINENSLAISMDIEILEIYF